MCRRAGVGLWLFLVVFLAGCVISPRRDGSSVSGGGSGSGSNTPQGKLYVSNDSGNAILRFDSAFTATGNVAPGATIGGTLTQLISPQFMQLDAAADRLYVADLGASAVVIFENASTKTGNIAPNRTIAGAATNLFQPVDLGLDRTRDLLYVADGPDILVFASASTANGNTPPVRTISPNPSFTISSIFLDATNDRLYVANPANAIDIFDGASTLTGAVAPNRQIFGSGTQLSQPSAMLVDAGGRLIVSNFSPPRITIFSNAATANGNITPSSVIAGGTTTLVGPDQIALNPNVGSGDLYVADPFAGEVAVFSNIATANGDIAPARNINGSQTGIARTGGATARGVALDTTR